MAEYIKWRRRGANQKLLKTCLALAIMADTWTWSADHQDHYRYTNENGNWVIHWAKQTQQQGGVPSGTRRDSLVQSPTLQYGEAPTNNFHFTPTNQGYPAPSISPPYTVNQTYSTAPNYSSGDRAYAGNTSLPTPQAAEQQSPPDQRQPHVYQRDQYGQSQQGYFPTTSDRPSQHQTNNAESFPRQPESTAAGGPIEEIPLSAIRGTPGEAEALDPEYRVQNSRFFRKGKMFAILFSEPLGNDTQQLDNANVSTVIYNQHVYSQIRRFVVVQERRGFCYACPIFTYGGRATTKSGVEPSEHAIIHIQGTRPRLVPGEATLEKKSIAVVPAGSGVRLAPASRINFGIQHPIQHNVKVKDLGTVYDEDMPYLIAYFRIEKDRD